MKAEEKKLNLMLKNKTGNDRKKQMSQAQFDQCLKKKKQDAHITDDFSHV